MDSMEIIDSRNPIQGILQETLENPVPLVEETRKPNKPYLLGAASEITENLLLSSASAILPSILEGLNVSCVINAAAELPDSPSLKPDSIYFKINVFDDPNSNISQYFDEASDIIHNVALSGRRTLVHCVAGISRSASLVIAYLMKHQNLTLLEAYNHVKQKRSSIRPNCGFFKQLIEYENFLFGCNTVKMVYNEYIKMEIPDVYDSQYQCISNYRRNGRKTIGRR